MQIPFNGQTYVDKTLNANAQDSINLYPMRTILPSAVKQAAKDPEKIIMYPTPGYKFQRNCGTGQVRGFYVINTTLYIVCGNQFLSYTPQGGFSDLINGNTTVLGTLNTSTGICSLTCNTVQIVISDGQYVYTYTIATGAFAPIGNNITLSSAATSTNAGEALTLTFVTTGNTNSTTSLTNVLNATSITVGMTVTGGGIPASTTVSSVSGTTVIISNAATTTTTGESLTFTASTTGNTNSNVSITNVGNVALAAIGQSISGAGIPSGATITAVSAINGFPATGGVTNVTYFDSYVIAAENNSKTVIQSNVLDATTWGAQAFDTIVTFPDNIVGVFSDELQLYIFGPKITEVQADAGTIPYAFQKVPNVLIQAGCAAVNTICKIGNTVMFLAADIAGKSYVAALEGYGTKVLSTPPINEAMERYSVVSDAFAYVYREGDNMFYVITFPTANATWAYDVKMDMWHKRSIGGGRDLPNCCTLWQGIQIVGDNNGNLYQMSQNYSTYSTYNPVTKTYIDTPLTRVRTTAHVNSDYMTLFINELVIHFQMGQGFQSDANLSPQPKAAAPLVTLAVSRDFGETWHTVGTRSLGTQGQYQRRNRWPNLGRFRQSVTFRVTITDAVGVYIIGADATVKKGLK